MAIEKLTPAQIRDATAGIGRQGKPRSTRFGDGGGLWLEVDPTGAKRWVFRYMLAGRSREMGLGSLDTYSPATARQMARDAREMLDRGIDPIEHRRDQRANNLAALAARKTFRDCAIGYVATFEKRWTNRKHAEQWHYTLAKFVFPKIGHLPVTAIDTPAVLRVVEPLWASKTETASRIRQRIEMILSWAASRGYRNGDNPAAWEILKHSLPRRADVQPVKHLEAMPYREVPALVARLRANGGTIALAIEFLILTAARREQVIGATWAEIDMTHRTWTIPGARMKSRQEHRVPLSGRCMEILELLPRDASGFLFVGARTKGRLSHAAMVDLLRRIGVNGPTPHGFRTSFRTWGAEQTAYSHELLEIALAHTQSDAVVRAYQRSDMMEKRRHCMESWADFLTSPPVAATVTPIRARV